MLFNSLEFLVFYPTVLILYFLISPKVRWIVLLIASYYFYMSWKWEYISLIILSTAIDYVVARGLGVVNDTFQRKLLLSVSLIANLGLLFYFKYFNFFIDSGNSIMEVLGIGHSFVNHNIILPVGISFYTFQTMSYTIEVYFRRSDVEKNFGRFALYVSYFPQLVAGPIERPQNLLHQLRETKAFNYAHFVLGMRSILWGFFKKVVVADRLAYFANIVFDSPGDYHGFSAILGVLFFTFQIYCDFSGYTDIAIGTAKILGVDLMKNFDTPYFSKSIKEFWSRWHISLSTWFRDYVYIPLGGNRTSTSRWIGNLFTTFLISGLWHGANWTFVIWGAIHGVFISLEALNSKYKLITYKPPGLISMIFTFIVVSFAWIFFRANNLNDALLVISNIPKISAANLTELTSLPIREVYNLLVGILLITLLVSFEYMFRNARLVALFERSKVIRMTCYTFIIVCIALFGVFVDQSSFIYFQF